MCLFIIVRFPIWDSDSGFLCLVKYENQLSLTCQTNPELYTIWGLAQCVITVGDVNLRLALATILNCKHGQFTCLCAIVCSSFTTINMATSGRTTCTPLGREDLPYVQMANRMAARFPDHF